MQKIKKHIAVLLAGVFIFPVIYQSVHKIVHHSEDPNKYHHVCKLHTSGNLPEDAYLLSELESYCPICAYEFSINKIPAISTYERITPSILISFDKTIHQQYCQQEITILATRAPPQLKA